MLKRLTYSHFICILFVLIPLYFMPKFYLFKINISERVYYILIFESYQDHTTIQSFEALQIYFYRVFNMLHFKSSVKLKSSKHEFVQVMYIFLYYRRLKICWIFSAWCYILENIKYKENISIKCLRIILWCYFFFYSWFMLISL